MNANSANSANSANITDTSGAARSGQSADTPTGDPVDAGKRLPDSVADVAIVGGGPAGLAAAALAARSGATTVVLEARDLGGRARTEDRNGVHLNLGPHALYRTGPGSAVLDDLGIAVSGGVPSAAGPGFAGDRSGPLPLNVRTTLTTDLLGVRSRVAFARFMAALPRLDTAELSSVSVSEYIDGFTERADLRSLLRAVIRLATYADAPDLMSAGAALEQTQHSLDGVRYLDRGWASLTAALESSATGNGASILEHTQVRSIDRRGATITVETSRGDLRAAAVIIAGPGPEAAERLTGLAPGSLRELAGPAVRAACLDLVLDHEPAHSFALDLDRALYYSVHSGVADLAPRGRTLASLAHYRRVDAAGDSTTDQAVLNDFAQRLGVGSVLDRRYLHDMVVANGIPLASRGGMSGRPRIDELCEGFGLTGVYLAGDWVGSQGMLVDASLASAAQAATAAVAAVAQRPAA